MKCLRRDAVFPATHRSLVRAEQIDEAGRRLIHLMRSCSSGNYTLRNKKNRLEVARPLTSYNAPVQPLFRVNVADSFAMEVALPFGISACFHFGRACVCLPWNAGNTGFARQRLQ